jgi:hypothetical protein
MGETLSVRPGAKIRVKLAANDPTDVNNSPYTFYNPSLWQIDVAEPINEPSVRHVDFIMGAVGEPFTPADPEYFDPLAPETTRIVASFDYDFTEFDYGGARFVDLTKPGKPKKPNRVVATYTFRADGDSYIRARGSNIPPGTPNVRDADGNPLPDNLNDNIPCDQPACPPHIDGKLDKDVEAWANLSFHTNPIFIEVSDD